MTKTTLKALWLGGGGVLATWLAVTPNQGVPTSAPTTVQRPAVSREPSADDLRAQANRLRERTTAVTLRASTRNPFRFNASRSTAAPQRSFSSSSGGCRCPSACSVASTADVERRDGKADARRHAANGGDLWRRTDVFRQRRRLTSPAATRSSRSIRKPSCFATRAARKSDWPFRETN